MTKDKSGPVVRMAELEIDPAQIDAYRRHLTEEIEASVAREPGVMSLSAVALTGSPASIRILEVYEDEAAYQAHLQSPHFLAYKARTAQMVLSLRLIDVDPVSLRGQRQP